jgi:CBS domain-containing protein
MTTPVATVDRITPYKEIARLLTVHKISGVPVLMMGRQVAGVVTEADLVREQEKAARHTQDEQTSRWRRRSGRKHQALTAANLMTTPAVTINAGAPIPTAARLMNTHHIRRLPVVDDDGTLVGIVSRRDLLSVFLTEDLLRLAGKQIWGIDGVVDVIHRPAAPAA